MLSTPCRKAFLFACSLPDAVNVIYHSAMPFSKSFFIFLTCLLSAVRLSGVAQPVIPLYTGSVPNARPDALTSDIPTLTVYVPAQANGTAVIICPGGGYGTLVIKREGYEVAEAFTKMGVTAFVLKYRLPTDKTMLNKSIGPLQDAQRALKLVRQRTTEWHLNPNRIGIMGFSAGGHLAATAGTQYNRAVIDNAEATRLRPDFMILVYPVISLNDSLGHAGTRNNLLGSSPTAEQIQLYSNELQVTKDTPPAFLLHAGDDKVVPVDNSLVFYKALQRNGVTAGMHIYPKGDHGFLTTPTRDEWLDLCKRWLMANGWLNS